MTVRAKFTVGAVERSLGSAYSQDANEGRGGYVASEVQTIKLNAVYGDGDEENKRFFAATPNGTISLTVVRKEIGDSFELGAAYYVDFTKA